MNMVFDLRKLQANPQPAPVAPAPVVASASAVLVNRPASQRPVVAPAEALTVTTIEGSAAAHALVEFVDTEGEEVPDRVPASVFETIAPSGPIGEAPPAPKARRGRPRKDRGGNDAASTAVVSTGCPTTSAPSVSGPSTPDPKAPAPTTTAPGCAPSVGDLAAAVSALIDAVRALECHGKTGVFLEAAFAALRGES